MSGSDTQFGSADCGSFHVPIERLARVRVRDGQLRGLEGTVVQWSQGRVLVQLCPGVRVELNGEFVERC